jgi:hypothetical protein
LKGAKLKGLFCCIPTEAVYGFAVHGLADQHLPTPVNALLTQYRQTQAFSGSWLFAKGEPLRPLSDDLQDIHNIAGAASKLANRNTEKQQIRFSRYSTISTIANYSDKQLEKGLLLALCRVLIVKQKTIEGIVTNAHIVDATTSGYDAIWSEQT